MDDKNNLQINENLKDNFLIDNKRENENKTAKNSEDQNNLDSDINKERKTNLNEKAANNEEEKVNTNDNEKLNDKDDKVKFNIIIDDNKTSNKSNECLQNKDKDQIKDEKK